jgi:hypothetical protein
VKSRKILPWIILVVSLIWISAAETASAKINPVATGTLKGTHAASVNQDVNNDERFLSIESRLTAIEQELGKSGDLQTRLSGIERNTNDLKGSEWLKTLLPAIISTLSALAGLWLGNLLAGKLQEERLKQEAVLAREKAKGEIGNAVIDWELKQLALLYGPVRALLGQSLGLYRQMSRVLAQARKIEFRLVQSSSSPDGLTLEVQTKPGEWERFRTVLHISRVYGQGFGVDTYFDEIVRIGHDMVEILKQQAGYARAEETDLMAVFGRYLAHFAVLSHVHKEAQNARSKLQTSRADGIGGGGSALVVDLSAVFPEEIHGLINQGFDALTNSVQNWRQRAVS